MVAKKDRKGDWQCVGTGVSVVTVTGSWDDTSGYLPSWTSNDVFIRILLIGGEPQNTTLLTSGQVQTLRGDIQKLLKGRDDCAKFVQALLDTVAANTQVPFYNADPRKVFDSVATSRGGGLFLSPGQGASGYRYGSINSGNAKITFDMSFGGFKSPPLPVSSRDAISLHGIGIAKSQA